MCVRERALELGGDVVTINIGIGDVDIMFMVLPFYVFVRIIFPLCFFHHDFFIFMSIWLPSIAMPSVTVSVIIAFYYDLNHETGLRFEAEQPWEW